MQVMEIVNDWTCNKSRLIQIDSRESESNNEEFENIKYLMVVIVHALTYSNPQTNKG